MYWRILNPRYRSCLSCKHVFCLQIGVGNSRLQNDMVLDGYSSITSVDFAEVVIEQMQQDPQQQQLQYAVADARWAGVLSQMPHTYVLLHCPFNLPCNIE